jgi:hypothetical protein
MRGMSDYYSTRVAGLPLFAAPARAPAIQHSRTSMAAADALTSQALNALQRQVVAFLHERGDQGATDEEMQNGIPMDPNTQRPRRRELAKRGLVVEAGTRRTASGRMAMIWRRAT